jgi:uncharacterized membrane protein YdjX (TVP38/TMEM64 family)
MTQQGRKLVVLTFIILGVWIVAWATGLAGRFTSESVRRSVAGTGLRGIVFFILIFAAGQLLRVPSTVFVAAAVALYGRNCGIAVALLGGVTSATVSFAAVRAFAGRALSDVQQPLVQRVLRNIDSRPILTVALLRLIFQTAPPLNYALPMTAVGWRDHLVGSVLGLPAAVVVMAFFFEWLLRRGA